jgi:poly-gamma-glutamate capsule biosynthesis protein CapA/YwtB (metallophosphatase superfamily)
VALSGGRRVLVFALGMASSGIPGRWAATNRRAGVNVADASPQAAAALAARVREHKRPGDVVVVSVHWGSNWGYEVPREHVRFAHTLVDRGVDVVHGHSSHHARPVEVYRDRLVLYGCGDFIDDYEGIAGYEPYRDDLRLLFLVTLDSDSGALVEARMVPLQARRMRLEHASTTDVGWLQAQLDRVSHPYGTSIVRGPFGLAVGRVGGHAADKGETAWS